MSARSVGWLILTAPLGLALSSGCSEAEVVRELRSLQGSEDAVFVCRDGSGVGQPFSACPDRDASDDIEASGQLSVYALVSQTLTNEVAVVNVSAGRVVDVDPGSPGFGFLRVGGRPVSMAASPGGSVSFVATADVGRNGIFALPTNCLDAPAAGEEARDLTSWPACRLDAAPGEVAVLVEPLNADGEVSIDCRSPELLESSEELPAHDWQCWTDVRQEQGPAGRRKLLVSLPDLGELVVIDAQGLLNTAPGSFPPCVIEKTLPLEVNVPPEKTQLLPADLVQPAADPEVECPDPTSTPMAAPPSRRPPQPAGFALADSRLYIADEAAPVIHVVDTTSVCNMTELEPLLPLSYREPARVVTTRRVAVSPLTPSNKRFVYAIDAEDQPGASVMAFDVSPGVNVPTPIIRPGSPELPGEKPDRLHLGASAKDITFAYRDLPYVDAATGVGTFGTLCDPAPSTPAESPGGVARPASDFQSGARPGLLRGLFGFIMLTNGNIAVVDVEDFDEPCRRPAQTNSEDTPDFRGCSGDPAGISYFSEGGEEDQTSTVTNEVSCLVVEPHRFRSAALAINHPNVGVKAPSLRGFPQLSLPASTAAGLPQDRPRLLAVPFVGPDGPIGEVFVGSTRYTFTDTGDELLPVDPNSRDSEQLQSLNSVMLPPLQPRAYAAEDTVTVVYEGAYTRDRTAGFLRERDEEGVLEDASLSFCAAGVYDQNAMTDYGRRELGLSDPDVAAAFGQEHADLVQITTAILGKGEAYWRQEARLMSYQDCQTKFGPHDADTLNPNRDFRIKEAFADHLVLEPLADPPDAATLEQARECFPTANKYRLRAGKHWVLSHSATGFNHDIVATGTDSACRRSCNPLKKWSKSRVFELSSTLENCRLPDTDGDPLDLRVGCAREGEVACVYDQGAPGESAAVQVGGPVSECILDGLTERFALYRGRKPTARDSVFTWQTTGGFAPLVMSLSNLDTTVSPQSLQFLQEPELMAVVDGAGLGLSLLSLDTFTVVKPSPFR